MGKGTAMRGGIAGMMKEAHRIQSKLEKVKEEIKKESWVAESAGGKVKVTINGAREITAVELDKELVNPEDIASLQDVIVSAINAAMTLADEKIKASTDTVTQGIRIPGMF